MTRYYPIYLDITGRLCLVVGGGPVAERKVRGLLEAGAQVRAVSPEFNSNLKSLAESGEIEAIFAPYQSVHLAGVSLVFAATNRREVNAQILTEAEAAGIPANAADAGEQGRFILPSVVRRGDLCISISTGGNSPLLAARLCREMETRFGPEYEAYVELLGHIRDYAMTLEPDPVRRRTAMNSVLDREQTLLDLLKGGHLDTARQTAETFVRTALHEGAPPCPERMPE